MTEKGSGFREFDAGRFQRTPDRFTSRGTCGNHRIALAICGQCAAPATQFVASLQPNVEILLARVRLEKVEREDARTLTSVHWVLHRLRVCRRIGSGPGRDDAAG